MNLSQLDSIPIFFIIGRPRSGTTMLRTIFDAHSNVSIPLESRVILFLYHKYKNEKKWDSTKLNSFFEDIFKQPKMDTWIVNKGQLKNDMDELGESATFSRLIKLLYLNYTSFFNKEEIVIIGDKNPEFSYFMDELEIILHLFPEAKIIHIIRDYRDHYLSMQNIDFEGNHMSLICFRWRYSFIQIRKLMKTKPNQYYFLRYEDLVSKPTEEVSKICTFLGINYQEQMIHYYTIKEKVLAIYPEEIVMKYHKSLFKPISSDNIFGWKNKLSKNLIEIADSVVGKEAEIAGYERNYKQFNLWYKLVVIPDIIYSKTFLTYKVFYDFFMPHQLRKNRRLFSRLYFFLKKFKK